MRSFAHLDYLSLEINQVTLMKYLVADKSTQSDDCPQITENGPILIESVTGKKTPPKRPPPPRIVKNYDEIDARKNQNRKPSFLKNDTTLKKKLHTLKVNTIKLSKSVHKKMTKKLTKSHSDTNINHPSTKSKLESSTSKANNYVTQYSQGWNGESTPCSELNNVLKPNDQLVRSRSLGHKPKTIPIIIKSENKVMSLEDLLNKNESVFCKFGILPSIIEFLNSKSSNPEIDEFDQCAKECLEVFVKTCNRQVKDTIDEINDRFSYTLDLNSIGLFSHQPDLFTVYCIPGWKQIRIIQDNNTKEMFLSLKSSQYQSWILLNREKVNVSHRWLCFPIYSINTLENETFRSEDNNLQKCLLKMMMLMCIKSIYNDDNFPKNIDPNIILLVSSNCGLVVIFKECLYKSEVFSFEFFECKTLDDIPEALIKSKSDMLQLITNFFQRPEIVPSLISSTWPLDYLALIFSELVLGNNELN